MGLLTLENEVIFPENLPVKTILVFTSIDGEEHLEALADFIKASQVKPEHIATHEYLADLFHLAGDEDMSERHSLLAEKLRLKGKKKKK